MPSISTFRGLTVPTVGGDTGIWGGELNTTIAALDAILGQGLTINSSTAGTNVTLSSSQCQSLRASYINNSSGPAQLNIPASNTGIGEFTIFHTGVTTQSPLTITAGSSIGAGGASVLISPNTERKIVSDGLNIFYSDYQYASIIEAIDGGAATPSSGAKPSLKMPPFGMLLSSWTTLCDTSSGTGNWTITCFCSSSPAGQNIAVGGTTPTMSGSAQESDGNVTGWSTYIPPFAVLTFALNSPANFTKCTLNLLGQKV